VKPLYIWAGGKNKMLKHYQPFFPNGVKTYSEPFFGGGAMFLHVIKRYDPKTCYINDINQSLINIYIAIKNNYGEFTNTINAYEAKYLPLSKEDRKKYYYDIRQEHAYDYQKWSMPEEAATLYFLMKTGFNGIWQINKNTNNRYGTPSGLLTQTTAVYDREVMECWHTLLSNKNIVITCGDWSNVPISDFTFYDPPYRNSFADYNAAFADSETEKLIGVVENNYNVWLCNRDSGDGFFDNRAARVHRFPVTYTAGRRKVVEGGHEAKKATEILMYNSKDDRFSSLFE